SFAGTTALKPRPHSNCGTRRPNCCAICSRRMSASSWAPTRVAAKMASNSSAAACRRVSKEYIGDLSSIPPFDGDMSAVDGDLPLEQGPQPPAQALPRRQFENPAVLATRDALAGDGGVEQFEPLVRAHGLERTYRVAVAPQQQRPRKATVLDGPALRKLRQGA